jgi:hypothetical protein
MPYGDGTGPLGLGPRTGWGKGYCSGYPLPGYENRGWYHAYYPDYAHPPRYHGGYWSRGYGWYPRRGGGWRRW